MQECRCGVVVFGVDDCNVVGKRQLHHQLCRT
jgi:hypothetical protein